jgi:hypothetical protein
MYGSLVGRVPDVTADEIVDERSRRQLSSSWSIS